MKEDLTVTWLSVPTLNQFPSSCQSVEAHAWSSWQEIASQTFEISITIPGHGWWRYHQLGMIVITRNDVLMTDNDTPVQGDTWTKTPASQYPLTLTPRPLSV